MAEETEEAVEPKKKSKLKLIIPIVVLVIGLGGGGFFFMSSSSKKADAKGKPTTTTTAAPGPIVKLDPITTNLPDGHILKVGIAMRMNSKPKDKKLLTIVKALEAPAAEGASASGATTSPLEGEESIATDLVISTLGADTYADLSNPEGKAKAKEELSSKIVAAYKGDVTEVYFNTFVMS